MTVTSAVRRRVLVVSDYTWPTGGTEEFVRSLLTALRESFDVELLTWQGDASTTLVETTYVANGDLGTAWSAFSRADVIMIVTSFNLRLLARLAGDYLAHSGGSSVTILQTSGHSAPEVEWAQLQVDWLSLLVSSSSVVVGVSDAVLDGIASILGRRAVRTRLLKIENGARLVDLDPPSRRFTRLAFIGRPTIAKGFDDFHALVGLLAETGLSFEANTVSVPPTRRRSDVDYTWNLGKGEFLEFLRRTDLLVVPYRHADGLPLAVLEALNCAVPVIGYESPSVGPLLRRFDQLVVDRSPHALADAVTHWRRGDIRLAVSAPGQVPSLEGQAKRYVEVVRKVMDDWA